jgi:hypothetical protein
MSRIRGAYGRAPLAALHIARRCRLMFVLEMVSSGGNCWSVLDPLVTFVSIVTICIYAHFVSLVT